MLFLNAVAVVVAEANISPVEAMVVVIAAAMVFAAFDDLIVAAVVAVDIAVADAAAIVARVLPGREPFVVPCLEESPPRAASVNVGLMSPSLVAPVSAAATPPAPFPVFSAIPRRRLPPTLGQDTTSFLRNPDEQDALVSEADSFTLLEAVAVAAAVAAAAAAAAAAAIAAFLGPVGRLTL